LERSVDRIFLSPITVFESRLVFLRNFILIFWRYESGFGFVTLHAKPQDRIVARALGSHG